MPKLKKDKNGLTDGQKKWADEEVGQVLAIAVRVKSWKPDKDGRVITVVEAVDGTGTIELDPRIPPLTAEEVVLYQDDVAEAEAAAEAAELAAREANAAAEREAFEKQQRELEKQHREADAAARR